MQPKQKLVTVNFLLVTFLNFLFSVTFYLMAVVMTGYATTEFGESSSTGSFAVSIYIFSSLLGRVFLGPKVDVWGPKKALMIAFGINLVVCLMYFAPATWGSFLALRFAQGICFALEGCAAATAAVFLIPPERKAEGVGYFPFPKCWARPLVRSWRLRWCVPAWDIPLSLLCSLWLPWLA